MLSNKYRHRVIILWGCFFGLIIAWTLWQCHNNFLITIGDTFFHDNRVYEIRYAFLHHEFPNWLNFQTFMHAGQAINGMYPDITLWPLVLITLPFSPIHQLICLRSLIVIIGFLATFITFKHEGYGSYVSSMVAVMYCLSGYILYCAYYDFQPGAVVMVMFAFPLFFVGRRILRSSRVEWREAIKFGLLSVLVLYSHFLSVIILITFIVGSLLWKLCHETLKSTMVSLYSYVISGVLTLILGLPVFERYLAIQSSHILAPFGKGNVTGESLMSLITGASWASRIYFPIISLILMALVCVFLNKDKLTKMTPLFYALGILCIGCSDISPWQFLNKIPFVMDIQFGPWRFGPLLGVIPILLFVINFSGEKRRRLLEVLMVLTFVCAFGTVTNYSRQSEHAPRDNGQLRVNQPVKMMNGGIGKDNVNAGKVVNTLLPDYAPAAVGTNGINGTMPSEYGQEILMNNYCLVNGKLNSRVKAKKIAVNNGIKLTLYSPGKGEVQLPIYGYKKLHYDVYVNGKHVPYWITTKGFIATHISKPAHEKIEIMVMHYNPMLYTYLLLMAGGLYVTFMCILVGMYFVERRKTFGESETC